MVGWLLSYEGHQSGYMDWARTGLLFSPSLSTPASSTFSFPSLIIIINRAIFGYHCVRSSVLWLPACRPGIFIWDTAVERSSLSIRMDYRNGHSLLLNTIYILDTQLRYDFQLTWLIAVERYFPVGHLPFSLSSWWLLLLHWGASRRWILTPVLPSFLTSSIMIHRITSLDATVKLFKDGSFPIPLISLNIFQKIFWGSLLRNFFQSGKTFSALARQHNVLAHRFVNFL